MGEQELFIGDTNHLVMKTSYTVTMTDKISIHKGGKRPVELDIKITADFEKVPSEYHNTFIQMLSARYGGTVNVYDNTEPFATKSNKKKWYQIWK
jgi:hypothetical protein